MANSQLSLNTGIVIFPSVEELDCVGLWEDFTMTKQMGAELFGKDTTHDFQEHLKYHPQPPFGGTRPVKKA